MKTNTVILITGLALIAAPVVVMVFDSGVIPILWQKLLNHPKGFLGISSFIFGMALLSYVEGGK